MFPLIRLYCCDLPEAKDTSAARFSAERHHFSVRLYSSWEAMMMGNVISSRGMAEMMETRRRVEDLRKEAGSPAGRVRSRTRR